MSVKRQKAKLKTFIFMHSIRLFLQIIKKVTDSEF